MRKSIAQYEEASPLYGFLKYRRRNVIVKYQPEGCSRLVQARATVHFNAVCDNFQPFNTTFELTNARDLKDTKLSAACSLHTATGSTSSSTSSLRRRRLMEITEEEEEERERKRQSIVHDEEENEDGSEATPHSPPLSTPEPPVVLDRQQITDPQGPDFASIPDPTTFSGAIAQPASPSKSEFDPEPPRRQSSQLTRPELHTYSSYPYGKPKVKLAPRPSIDANLRPHTSGNYRPIAALPAGFKLAKAVKKNKAEHKMEEEETNQKEQENSTTNATSAAAHEDHQNPGAANSTNTTLVLPARPATSSGASLKGSSALADKNKMTPEKARLMKAMKLREKKKKLSLLPTEVVPEPEPPKTESTAMDVPPPEDRIDGDDDQSHDKLEVEPATTGTEHPELPTLPMHSEANTEDTSTASHPPSPTVGSSEVGVSTKASSLSESTDETVQYAAKDTGIDADDGPPGPENQDIPNDEVHYMENEPREAEPLASATIPNNNETVGGPVVQHEAADEKPDVSEASEEPVAEGSSKTSENERQAVDVTAASAASPKEATAATDESKIEVQIPQSRSQEVAPLNQDEPSPKSPYGVPLSRFSSNEPKSPATPTLKSRFSTQDLRKASFAEAIPVVAEVIPSSSDVPSEKVQPTEESKAAAGAEQVTPELPSKAKRKPSAIDPARAELARDTPHSDTADPLLDEALLDELQTATVQHAQSMTVAKSPITPVFPSTSPRKSQVPTLPRAVSNPIRNSLLVPGNSRFGSLRSVSMNSGNLSRQSSNASMQSKPAPSVGSSISQRIKALEQMAGKEKEAKQAAGQAPAVAAARNRPTTPSAAFFPVRKSASIREPSVSPSVTDAAGSVKAPDASPEESREGSPDQSRTTKRDRSASVQSRLSVFEPPNPTLSVSYAPRGRPEAVQVTARIVRDGGQPFPKRPVSRDEHKAYDAANLKQSPIVVEHQKAEPAQEPASDSVDAPLADAPTIVEQPKETILERRNSKLETENGTENKRRTSLSIVKGFIKDRRTSVSSHSNSVDNLGAPSPAASSRPASAHHSSSGSIARRLSMSSRRSMSRERDTPAGMSPSSISEINGKGEKQSTASRLMRRLSSSLSGGRKAQSPSISPTVAEEDDGVNTVAPPPPEPTVSTKPIINEESLVSSYLGDVNVQFPDNLLWKRRSLCLDSAGFLVLSALQGHAPTAKDRAVGTKRYHMSDFRLPYIPDADVQELPNSVVLDFVFGSGLQVACEDRAGQMMTLHALEDAHRKYTS
ncbi:Gpi-anchored cell surface glycoprotein [Apiospora aurea]|uniref:Gpi-anchored cell surface glycoprotein n=1 Tax=Apiospora aurea TaxID=335848 RepID=A0ABR1PTR4_9PEZI